MSATYPVLDLHGVDHDQGEFLIEKFITDNFKNLPVKVITGFSPYFIDKTKEVTARHHLFCYKENYTNEGCWVIIRSPWFKRNKKA